MRPPCALLLLALLARAGAAAGAGGACTPSCRSSAGALEAAKELMRTATAGDSAAPMPRRLLEDAAAASAPGCHLKMHTRREAHEALSGTWLIMLGKSWTQAITFAMLQVLDAEQSAPVDPVRWYGLSKETGNEDWMQSLVIGYADYVWDGAGKITHKRVGEYTDNMRSPPLPAGWNGTRVTVVSCPYWGNVTQHWDELAALSAEWHAVRRVAFLNVGEWYLLARGHPTLYPRSPDLYKMPVVPFVETVRTEARATLRHIADAAARTAVDVFVASVPCDPNAKDCKGGMRGGLADEVRASGGPYAHFFDMAALAEVHEEERRVEGHPSLLLSSVTWNLLLGLALPPPRGERCAEQRVVFDDNCYKDAMYAAHPGDKQWQHLQQTPCSYAVERSYGGAVTHPPAPPPRQLAPKDVPPQPRAPLPALPPPARAVGGGKPPAATAAAAAAGAAVPVVRAETDSADPAAPALHATTHTWRHVAIGLASAALLAAWGGAGMRKAAAAAAAAARAPASVGDAEGAHVAAAAPRMHGLTFARLLASLHVALGHLSRRGAAPASYFASWGYTWVPWFVLLSGFVLSVADLAATPPRTPKPALRFVADRLRGVYPAYALSLGVAYALRMPGQLREPGTLLAQAALLQAWIPAWVERCLQQHTWFISAVLPCWALHAPLNAALTHLSNRGLWATLAACAALGWLPALLPPLFGEPLDWYTDHDPSRPVGRMTRLDVAVAALKFHPLAIAHLYVLGAALAHLRARRGWGAGARKEAPWLVRRGACVGYAMLLAVFTVPALRPPAHKLSARLGALAVPQALLLLGLSCGEDPLAGAFSAAPLRMIGEVSFGVYLLQFICFRLWGGATAGIGYWLFLLASAVAQDVLVVRQLRTDRACVLFVAAAAALCALLLLAHGGGGGGGSGFATSSAPLPPAPAYVALGPGRADAHLNISGAAGGALLINPSLAVHAGRLYAAARSHAISRPSAKQQLWSSGVLWSVLPAQPAGLSRPSRLQRAHLAGLPTTPLSLAACAAARNGSAPAVLAVGAEDPRLLSYNGQLWVTYSALVPIEPGGARECAADVARRVFASRLLPHPRGGARLAATPVTLPAALPLRREEKNWLLFAVGSRLYAVYDLSPFTVAPAQLRGGAKTEGSPYRSAVPALDALVAAAPGMQLHGGANPVPVWPALRDALGLVAPGAAAADAAGTPTHLLAAFHSQQRGATITYRNYLFVFDASPPFRVLRVSAPLQLTEAPAGDGGRTGTTPMALLTGIAHRLDDDVTMLSYGSSNAEARVLALDTPALVALLMQKPAAG